MVLGFGAEDCRHAEFFAGHLVDDLGHGGFGGDVGECVAGVHEIADASEAFADAASGVEVGEVGGAEVAAVAEGEGEGVAEGEHDRSGGGGSLGWAGRPSVETLLRCRGRCRRPGRGVECSELQRAMSVTGRRLSEGGGFEDLLGFTAVGECEDDVVGGDHAQVAVDGFGGVKEVGGCAGGAKGGGDLAGDDAGFADAGEEDALRCRCFESLSTVAVKGRAWLCRGGGRGRGARRPRCGRSRRVAWRVGLRWACCLEP